MAKKGSFSAVDSAEECRNVSVGEGTHFLILGFAGAESARRGVVLSFVCGITPLGGVNPAFALGKTKSSFTSH